MTTAQNQNHGMQNAAVGDHRPWLADDASIALTDQINHFSRCRRDRPRPPGHARSEDQLWQDIAASKKAYNTLAAYASCPPDWQFAFAELALRLKASRREGSLLSEAALLWHIGHFEPDLMDSFVARHGLETTVEIVCCSLQLWKKYSDTACKYILTRDIPLDEENALPNWHPRLCGYLSTAPEEEWQRCANKLIAAIPTLSPVMQPLIALLLPERTDIANDMALRFVGQNIPAMGRLKSVVTDDNAIAALRHYPFLPANNFGYISFAATQMADRGIKGMSRTLDVLKEEYAAELCEILPQLHVADYLGKWLWKVNHPDALKLLILSAGDKNKRLEFLSKASQRHPHAAIAAYAELLKEQENPIWRQTLTTLIAAAPERAEQVLPWISEQAVEVLASCRQQEMQMTCASSDSLPQVLVTPPWLAKTTKAAVPAFDLPTLAVSAVVAPTRKMLESHGEYRQIAQRQATRQTMFIDLPPLEQRSWEPMLLPQTPEQQILWRLGFENWRKTGEEQYEKLPIPQSAVDALLRDDFPTLKAERAKYCGDRRTSWNLAELCYLPGEQAISLLNQIINETDYYGESEILTIFGPAAVPAFLTCLNRDPRRLWHFTASCGTSELALPMARLLRKKTQHAESRDWLLKYPEHAAAGLLPVALGKTKKDREDARLGLRLLAENGRRALIEEVAQRYHQPAVSAALTALLNDITQIKYPSTTAPLPGFWQPTLWRRPQLKTNGLPLGDDALCHLGTLLSFPREVAIHGGLMQVKEACTPETLAAFAWDLYEAWEAAGAPSKENWGFTALGILGDDNTARDLTRFIRAWPGESRHKRAITGLDILAEIGSDIALMQLNGIAQKIKFKALQEAAREKIKQIADKRELTIAELEDRLAPDLGLDDSGTLTLDFGPRRFTLGFDEALKPFVRDESGRRLKDLPKPGKSDDEPRAAEAVSRYRQLKKDARTIASQQIQRLETAMSLRRRWTAEQFRLFLVDHPLVRHLTRRLVWGVYSQENVLLACFRVAEDNSYSDAEDNLFSLPEGQIGLPHVLEISAEDAAAFGQLYADYELLPPFRQLDRNHYRLTESENRATELTRWRGRQCQAGRIVGLERKGWQRIEDGGSICGMFKPAASGDIVLEVEPFSLLYGETTYDELIPFETVKIVTKGDIDYGKPTFAFATLDAIAASELINDIESLFD